jgi:hypothetical protein
MLNNNCKFILKGGNNKNSPCGKKCREELCNTHTPKNNNCRKCQKSCIEDCCRKCKSLCTTSGCQNKKISNNNLCNNCDDTNHYIERPTQEKINSLKNLNVNKLTKTDLIKICKENGIENKSKDTKALLGAKIEKWVKDNLEDNPC